MNAKEARRLSDANIPGNIQQFIAVIDQRIAKVIETGEHSLQDPFSGFDMTPDQEKAVRKHYLKNEYTIEDHPNPDPGHPCSRAYTTMEW